MRQIAAGTRGGLGVERINGLEFSPLVLIFVYSGTGFSARPDHRLESRCHKSFKPQSIVIDF
jgi:hypothetical protein